MDFALVFDLWGDYAHYRKVYTTTSPITYPFPPRPTLVGIVAAIIGLEQTDYPIKFVPSKLDVALQLMAPVKTTKITTKLVNPKSATPMMNRFTDHMLIPFEFVKDPKYRIFLRFSDQTVAKIMEDLLKDHQSFYNPALGLSELLADFQWIGKYTTKKIEGKKELSTINTVSPTEDIKIRPRPQDHYLIERVPRHLSVERVATDYYDVIGEINGQPLEGECPSYWRIEDLDTNLLFL